MDPALLPRKMGIERMLNGQFGDRLGEVIQLDPEEEEGGKRKTAELLTAIIAMGEWCAWWVLIRLVRWRLSIGGRIVYRRGWSLRCWMWNM